jgi:hypothetical protein
MLSGKSTPGRSDADTHAFDTSSASLPAPKAGVMRSATAALNPANNKVRLLLAATTIATIDQPSTSCRRLAIVGENLNMMMLVVRCTIDPSLTFFCFDSTCKRAPCQEI